MSSYFRRVLLLLFLFLQFTVLSSCSDLSFNAPDGLIVIIKADDLGEITPNWSRFMKIVADDSICAGIGIISKNVRTQNALTEIKQITTLKQSNNFPIIEFWNHGFDHSNKKGKTEFDGNNSDYQMNHMQMAQKFFSDTLQTNSHCFGAPYNRTSNITAEVIKNFPDINIWQCDQKLEKQNQSDWKDPDKVIINSDDLHILLNIEYLYFRIFPIKDIIDNYDRDNAKPYIVIQIHPAMWHDENFADFEKLIRFYKTKHRATFMTPYQYYQYLHKIKTAV